MRIQEIIEQYPPQDDYLLEMMLAIQKQQPKHHLSEDDMRFIANYCGVKESRVSSVATFYSLLYTEPQAERIIHVCHNVPCFINGQESMTESLLSLLNTTMDRPTEDDAFVVKFTSCLGACDKAPVVRVGDQTYTHMNRDKIKALIAQMRGKRHG